MNEDRMEGNWKQFKGKVKEQWGKLTDDDLDVISGRRDQLAGNIQERHGLAREMSLPEILDDLERQLILKAYAKAGRVKTIAVTGAKRIAVSRDMRLSSPELAAAFIDGATAQGCEYEKFPS